MASLLVRHDLHPAVQYLLLQAAEDIHSGPGILRRPGQFPAAEPQDVPLSRGARNYYKSGGSFFQRHLPFWLVRPRGSPPVRARSARWRPLPAHARSPWGDPLRDRTARQCSLCRASRDRRADRGRGLGRGALERSGAAGGKNHTLSRSGLRHPSALRASEGCEYRPRPTAGRGCARDPGQPADTLGGSGLRQRHPKRQKRQPAHLMARSGVGPCGGCGWTPTQNSDTRLRLVDLLRISRRFESSTAHHSSALTFPDKTQQRAIADVVARVFRTLPSPTAIGKSG